LMLVCQFAGLTLLLAGANLVGQTSLEILRAEVAAHRTSRTDFIRTSGAGDFRGLLLRIEVDRTGSVTSAKVTEGAEKFRAAALAMAQSWRYKPFVRDGRAVPAAFTDFVMILPPERAVRTSKAFPTVQNWDSVKIALKRTACYGDCPVYEVKIDGHGNVLFNGSVGQQRAALFRVRHSKVCWKSSAERTISRWTRSTASGRRTCQPALPRSPSTGIRCRSSITAACKSECQCRSARRNRRLTKPPVQVTGCYPAR
jgi:hypothetical protein